MEQKFEDRKKQIIDDLSDMSEIAEDMLQKSIKALDEKNIELAREIINRDDVLDNYQITIEEEISRLMMMEKPVLSDTGFCLAVIKIATDLERIGDHSTNIAEIVLELKNEDYLQPLVMIPELANIVSDMLDAVLEAFTTKNVDLAEAACRKDEQADNINDQIYQENIKLLNKSQGTSNINQIIQFTNVAKSLERIGDHATNIGELTIFLVTGKRVKY